MQKQIDLLEDYTPNNLELNSKRIDSAISFAQEFSTRSIYTMKDAISHTTSSTTYRRLHDLHSLGLANFKRGVFEIKRGVVSQPIPVLKKLIPSLIAFKNARRFGRHYTESDINFVKKRLPGKFLTTLDYAAWELTKFQTPSNFFMYVNDLSTAGDFLKDNGFREGSNGRVILLPKIGEFDNKIERIYLDCIANDGRSILDAISIELLYEDYLTVKGHFSIESVKKVQEDMPRKIKLYE
ncbi:MAG: hypothetical protein ACYC6W_10280 [Nitrosotalea sp.]